MPSYWVKVTLSQVEYNIPLRTEWDYRVVDEPTTAAMLEFATEWRDTFLPLVNAIQADTVENYRMSVVWRGNTAVQAELVLTGGGDVVTTADEQQVSSASITIKKYVSNTFLWDDDSQFTDPLRTIKRGMVYVPGATDEWVSSGRSSVPSGLASDMTALVSGMADTIVADTRIYIPVVHGYALPAITGDNPRAARPEVYADIESAVFKWVTWHEARQDNSFR